MSTRALVAVYENGKLKATFFHQSDGYVSYLGNMLKTFSLIVRDQMNTQEGIPQNLTKAQINAIIKKRSGLRFLQKLFDIEGYFVEKPYFKDWWCLEYIYRINFTFDPKASYCKWEETLEYTKEIAPVCEKWNDLEKFTPLIAYEGVHYVTETDLDKPIHPRLYGKVSNRELPQKPEPEAKSA